LITTFVGRVVGRPAIAGIIVGESVGLLVTDGSGFTPVGAMVGVGGLEEGIGVFGRPVGDAVGVLL
jgi:hypothetical protein